MVVVSGSWVKNVGVHPPPPASTASFHHSSHHQHQHQLLGTMVISDHSDSQQPPSAHMATVAAAPAAARAELHCRPNSYHFQERSLGLQQPAKVGRSVARARASADNAIFDCKVLSRHHALLWYDAGKFYLQDTNSSNGTFVNNARLPSNEAQPHEVNSGDIVQFGVDVVENNKKVTHGCIIATLRLYMPDGKEAKASPSISENPNQCVPLDELYKLNQIIQEASEREVCLETKLAALQHVVEETRKSADESWQAYIGEERLLSRVATLESQLQQATKNWADDRLKEEISKLQDDATDYQCAAKEALNKVHCERLGAMAAATEQERARAAAEHDALYAKDQMEQAQQQLQEIAQKLILEQQRGSEATAEFDQKQKELLAKLDEETQQVFELHNALVHLRQLGVCANSEILEKYNIICTNDDDDDLKHKEEIIRAENEQDEKSNVLLEEPEQNHINIQVMSVLEAPEVIISSSDVITESDVSLHDMSMTDEMAAAADCDSDGDTSTSDSTTSDLSNNTVNVNLEKEDFEVEEIEEESLKYSSEEKESTDLDIDSKTLKYHVQSIHSQYKQEIANLQAEALRKEALLQQIIATRMQFEKEKEANLVELTELRENHQQFKQKFRESINECLQLRDRLETLQQQQKVTEEKLQALKDSSEEKQEKRLENSVENNVNNIKEETSDVTCASETSYVTCETSDVKAKEEVSVLETELVTLKERYAQLSDEKTALNKKLASLHDDYNALCNRSYNTMFCYIAPLVFMVIYLLVSSMFS